MLIVILNIAVLLGLMILLKFMANKRYSFSKRVFTALFLGVGLGLLLNILQTQEILIQTKEYYDIFGKGYVALLKMIAMPLIMVSLVSSIINLKDVKEASSMGGVVVGVLLFTASIASIVSIIITYLFNLKGTDILGIVGKVADKDMERLALKSSEASQTISQKVVSIIPQNPFLDFTGARDTSTIAVVIFCIIFGIAILGIKKKKPESAKLLIDITNALNDVVFRIVQLVLKLTPYGVLALISGVVATSNFIVISKLLTFVLASYVALFAMFLIHLLIVSILGYSPIIFVNKSLPALLNGFSSRSSSATIPLTVNSQEKMGIEKGLANIAATFGTSIGQNGCASIYPTMLAIMATYLVPNIVSNPYNIAFLIKLVLVVTISSLGVAGVGGGATFSAIIVLTTLGLPIEIVGFLVSVEAIIDMGRTALNINGSIVAGLVSANILKKIDKKIYDKYM